jgi:general secretion pathway protein K
MALLSVLWVVALLTLIVTGLSVGVRSEGRVVGNIIVLQQARFAVEGGVELAVMNLLYPRTDRWPADGSIREVRIGDARVRISTLDEAGKIDINYASAELINSLLLKSGVETDVALWLADSILDWRDKDEFRRLNGAEDSDYRAAGLSHGAKDARFESVDELRLVLGMTEEIFAAIATSVTVYSGQSGVNPLLASPLVLEAVAGISNLKSAKGGSTFAVRVEARIGDKTVSQAEAIIRMMSNGAERPYRILRWHQPLKRLFSDSHNDDYQGLIR